jgi:hypothetical protein
VSWLFQHERSDNPVKSIAVTKSPSSRFIEQQDAKTFNQPPSLSSISAVIGLIRQIHSYERSPNSRRPKADVGGGNPRSFLQVSCKPSLTFASRYEDASRSSYANKGLEITAFEQEPGKWRARIITANGRPLKGDDRQLLESVTGATAVDALTLALP